MVILPPNNQGALVIDANVLIAYCAGEAGRDTLVTHEFAQYAALGYQTYVPGVIVSETLYVLCNKQASGVLSSADYNKAVRLFHGAMMQIAPPPSGDAALIPRAAQIADTYGCSRSADGIYIALAEELAQTQPAVLLTFDQGMANQAAKNAPAVTVRTL